MKMDEMFFPPSLWDAYFEPEKEQKRGKGKGRSSNSLPSAPRANLMG
jgi:DNA-directed RNA polymerase III subunit RPC7